MDEKGKPIKIKNIILKQCKVRAADWAETVTVRVAGSANDLHASDTRYHNDSLSRFFSQRNAPGESKGTHDEEQEETLQWLQTTQPTSGGAVTADPSCCANCVEPPRPQQWGPDLPFLGHAAHADPLDGWRCCSQTRVMSRPIQVRQL